MAIGYTTRIEFPVSLRYIKDMESGYDTIHVTNNPKLHLKAIGYLLSKIKIGGQLIIHVPRLTSRDRDSIAILKQLFHVPVVYRKHTNGITYIKIRRVE